jgi:predicted nucleotidyltransferase
MDKKTSKLVKDYISFVISKNIELVKVYLFGSYAKHSETKDSDIDIALIIKDLKDEDKFDLQVRLMLFASKFDLRIEPHPISNSDFNSSNPFAYEIRKTGVEIL